jgi:hypothetical protein
MKQTKAPTDPMLKLKHMTMREPHLHLGKTEIKGIFGRHPSVMTPKSPRKKKGD